MIDGSCVSEVFCWLLVTCTRIAHERNPSAPLCCEVGPILHGQLATFQPSLELNGT